MSNPTAVSTACLDVTLQVNTAWVENVARRGHKPVSDELVQAQTETMILCSDIISVDDELRARPDFETASYVMNEAIAHTERFCAKTQATIRAFRSVEVLRMIQPGLPASFLFLFEAIVVA